MNLIFDWYAATVSFVAGMIGYLLGRRRERPTPRRPLPAPEKPIVWGPPPAGALDDEHNDDREALVKAYQDGLITLEAMSYLLGRLDPARRSRGHD